MKTVLEYAERMPKGLKIRYLKNVIARSGVHHIYKKYNSFHNAIDGPILWANTEEGHSFWESIALKGIKETYINKNHKQYFKTPKI